MSTGAPDRGGDAPGTILDAERVSDGTAGTIVGAMRPSDGTATDDRGIDEQAPDDATPTHD